MSGPLDALLSELAPPPVAAGLAARAADAALALPQEPALPVGRGGRRDRRGAWLRRPLIAGGIALGLAFSGAVAATLAGVEVALPPKVQTVLAEVPFFGRMAKAEPPAPAPAPRRRVTPSPSAPAEAAPALTEPDPMLQMRRARAVRRYLIARQIVAERRAAGLPTPRADRIEQVIEQRLVRQGVLPADPVERAEVRAEARRAWRERMLARREARRARFGESGMAPPAESAPAAGSASTEELNRLALRQARAERMRAVRIERMRRWRERREERLRPIEDNAAEATAEPVR
jgi:hypothetical protein